MLSIFLITSLVVSRTSGLAIPREIGLRSSQTYDHVHNEAYNDYHHRYSQLGCQHSWSQLANTDEHKQFWEACCHPLHKGESMDSRPAQCIPQSSTPATAPAEQNPGTDESPDPTPTTMQAPAASQTPTQQTPQNAGGSSSSSSEITGGHGTYFYQNGNPGACGEWHNDNDRLVAIDQAMWNNGANCGRTVHITDTATGNTVDAVVKDMCPTCDNGQSLDLSLGAFQALASLDKGLLQISYHFMN